MIEINPLSKFLSPLISFICGEDTISVPGIVCGTIWGSFPVSNLGIICGPVQIHWDWDFELGMGLKTLGGNGNFVFTH